MTRWMDAVRFIPDVLDARFKDDRRPAKLAKRVARQALLGLDYLHQHGIGHGDLHTRNLAFALAPSSLTCDDELFERRGTPETGQVQRLGGKRADVVDRQILAFSVSYDHSSARIQGYYPAMDGKTMKHYGGPIHAFDFTALEGKEKWTAYRLTKNIYDTWTPTHFKTICSTVDQLQFNLNFDGTLPPEI
ncbi:hypothetical protein F66182_7884 [Fusarium sp. NRRL 66182]|nr:hypothetical protein F66182_7884 [Fusarium sp. NRRL 66182]